MLDLIVRIAVFAVVFVAILGALAMIRLRVEWAARGRRLREARRAECRREWDVYNPCFASPVLPMPPVNADGTIPLGPNTILPPLRIFNPGPVTPIE